MHVKKEIPIDISFFGLIIFNIYFLGKLFKRVFGSM